jgi:hypothetical protein
MNCKNVFWAAAALAAIGLASGCSAQSAPPVVPEPAHGAAISVR